eukprot:scaffold23996_cov117-Cylindrotheca_fusiformis.AAC.1
MCISLAHRPIIKAPSKQTLVSLKKPSGIHGINLFTKKQLEQLQHKQQLLHQSNDTAFRVQHNYHDHACDCCPGITHVPARGGVITPFPLKLHAMLKGVEQDGLQHIVSWQPHGRCFAIHDSKEFAKILPDYFQLSKISSFQRQLNLYGFQRITRGRDRGGYYHELFLRGKTCLAQNIHRVKVKGTRVRARANPEQEPNFYDMPEISKSSMCKAFPPPAPQSSNFITNDQLPLEPFAMENTSPDDPLDAMLDIPQDKWECLMMRDDELLLEQVTSSLLKAEEAEQFFEDFNFPSEKKTFENIENDNVFGGLLEQMLDS